MRNKTILFSLILVASGPVLAEQSLLEGAAKQAVTDKATAVAPNAVGAVEDANQALDKAKSLKSGLENTPAALQGQTKETVKEKVTAAVPEEAKKSGETLKTGKDAAENLKEKAGTAPKATKTLKNKAKVKTAEKALNVQH